MNRKPKILVVGSFAMDQTASTKIFPRAGQSVRGTAFNKAPGGKGANQAVQAARLGADVTMFGKLGRDSNGEEMLAACRQAGIHTEYIIFDEKQASGCTVIILEEQPDGSNQNRIIVIPGANMTITEEEVAGLCERIGEYDLVMLQLEIPPQINEMVAAAAHAKGVPVMLNPAPSAPLSDRLLSCLTFLSPNETEAEDLTGVTIRRDESGVNLEDVRKATRVLLDKGVKNVLITLGSTGALLTGEEGEFFAPCATGITAVDPTAAGDSFVAAFCVGVCCGWSWEETLTFANHTAAVTVSGKGAMPSLPELPQVEEMLRSREKAVPNTENLK